MEYIRFGKTELKVTRTGFGALPIQRLQKDDAVAILRRAYDAGINLYDTARSYSDSEEKIGAAFTPAMRKEVIITTKTPATTYEGVMADAETSLRKLNTDYIDVLQLHNPQNLPDPQDPHSAYGALAELKKQGKIRFIGLTNHRLTNMQQALAQNAYEVMQFPLSHLASEDDLQLIRDCAAADIPLLAMKALSGGLITNAAPSFAFLRQFENVVPIWGVQRMWELENILDLEAAPPALDGAMWELINKDRQELMGSFCRGCGYCMPCPVDIPINMAARMALLLRRSPYAPYLTDEWKEKMERIENCLNCGQCAAHCPYHLDTPNLLREMLADYRNFYAEHKK